jgi:hypothetical protein
MSTGHDKNGSTPDSRLLAAESTTSDQRSSTEKNRGFAATQDIAYPGTNRHHEAWYKLWWLEIAALFLSFACLAANIGVLFRLDGRPYSNWQIKGVQITPNTLVSLIATFSKSALLLPIGEGLAQLKWSKTCRLAIACCLMLMAVHRTLSTGGPKSI